MVLQGQHRTLVLKVGGFALVNTQLEHAARKQDFGRVSYFGMKTAHIEYLAWHEGAAATGQLMTWP